MFAPAYAGMAQAYVPFAYFGFAPPGDAFPAMRAAAEKALELDPALVDAHVALAAEMAGYRWDWPGALSAWKRVLDRHPNHAVARHWHGLSLEILGRFDEALAERLRAIELDPLSLQFNTSVAGLLHRMGRRDEAIARFHRTLELEPDFTGAHLGLGQALLMSGRTGEAMAELRRAVSLSNDALSHAILGYACGVTGDTAAARQILGDSSAARTSGTCRPSTSPTCTSGSATSIRPLLGWRTRSRTTVRCSRRSRWTRSSTRFAPIPGSRISCAA